MDDERGDSACEVEMMEGGTGVSIDDGCLNQVHLSKSNYTSANNT